MWIDRRKRHTICVRLDDVELGIVDEIASALGIDKSEAIRRTIWTTRILFDPNLRLRDALIDNPNPDAPLFENLKPIPELAYIIGIELNIIRKIVQARIIDRVSTNNNNK